ncbi:MAG: hypothetical protein O2923_02515 [Verrucomicrobia bacterium]|nr:hypothetical protein [Verrucomicrobiota bacterium]MDA1086146.1 hypothetical protein [Verrucomicrobiota bacterium]
MIRTILKPLRQPVLQVVAVTSRCWLLGEAAALRGVRWLGRSIHRLLCVLGPLVERAVMAATPHVVSLAGAVASRSGRLWARMSPYAVKFWIFAAPVRTWIVRACSWLTNLWIQVGDMNYRESAVFQEHLDPDHVVGLIRTRTRVDVGMWFRKGRVWACMQPAELVLLAQGKRPWVQHIAHESLRESRYNHVTGEVALAPGQNLPLSSLRVKPLEGIELLKSIGTKEIQHA